MYDEDEARQLQEAELRKFFGDPDPVRLAQWKAYESWKAWHAPNSKSTGVSTSAPPPPPVSNKPKEHTCTLLYLDAYTIQSSSPPIQFFADTPEGLLCAKAELFQSAAGIMKQCGEQPEFGTRHQGAPVSLRIVRCRAGVRLGAAEVVYACEL